MFNNTVFRRCGGAGERPTTRPAGRVVWWGGGLARVPPSFYLKTSVLALIFNLITIELPCVCFSLDANLSFAAKYFKMSMSGGEFGVVSLSL